MMQIEPVNIAVAALALVALVAIGGIVWVTRRLLRELRRVDGFVGAVGEPTDAKQPLADAVREHVVGLDPHGRGRFVLSRSLAAIRREYAEDEVAHAWPFWLGGLLTGFALIATFGLIAWVMTHDVSAAIRDSADDKSTQQLSGAVGLLGGKFAISAVGVGGSIVALVFGQRARASIYRAAEHPDRALLDAFTSIEQQQLQHLLSLNTRIEKLNSIEVSVKTIGNEVSANLKHLMKDAIGEELREILATTMGEVAGIAERVQQSLTDSFAEQVGALRKAVEGQGQGQLEQILEQLQNTVSGGFQSESTKMVAALDAFARVVPALEQQLRGVMDRVGSLVETMGAQHAASTAALQASATDVVGGVLGASRAEIEAMVAQLKAAAETNAQSYASVEARVGGAATAVGAAAAGLTRSANSIIEVANHTQSLVHETRGSTDSIQAAAREFQAAGGGLLGAVGQLQGILDASRAQAHEQQQLLEQQRAYMREVEAVWPSLFTTYLTQFKAGADELGRSWNDFHEKVAKTSNAIGGEFGEHTEALADAVEKLAKLQGARS